MKHIHHFIKNRPFLSIIGAIIIVAIIGMIISSGNGEPPKTFSVRRGTITQEVTVTGKTKPVTDIRLAFEKAGTVSRVPVKVGDAVQPGDVLAELSNTELRAQLAEAEATLAVQQAKLNELKRGSRPEDVQIKQTELKKAEQDLANDYQSVFDTLNDAYVKADDAVRKETDDLFTNDEETNPQLTFSVFDTQKEIDAEFKRQQASTELRAWKAELDTLVSRPTDRALMDQDIAKSTAHLLVIREFLNKAMDAVLASASLSATTANTYKANITTARTSVATALTNVSTQAQTIASQKVTVLKIQDELALTLAGSTPETVAGQQAQVMQASANVDVVRAQLAKTVIRSPIAGIVTKQDAEIGEIAQPNTPLVAVISGGQLEIEANVPEVDMAKMNVGDPASITLDAYGDDVVFAGRVAAIDPAETVVEGVPTYRTTFTFAEPDPTIKPGLTANLTVIADQKEQALIIPQQLIVYRDGKKFVTVHLGPDATEEREVRTGIRGTDGTIEILSGLAETDTLREPARQ
jgi:HlyD family secretion protein